MKVHIAFDPFGSAKIYFVSEHNGTALVHRQVYDKENKSLNWEQEKVELSRMLPLLPSMELSFIDARETLISLGEAVQAALGEVARFAPGRVDVLEGELKATKEHLVDMRNLVFKYDVQAKL